MAQKRLLASDGEKARAAEAFGKRAADFAADFTGKIAALYSPLKGELDTNLLAKVLAAEDAILALPAVLNDNEMVFKAWDGKHQTPDFKNIPTGTGDRIVPDIVFVPLLAFDRAGHRLGYGAGYYDKTLALLPAVRTIGLAFSWQETAKLPSEPHDIPLTEIWTEKERIYAKNPAQK